MSRAGSAYQAMFLVVFLILPNRVAGEAYIAAYIGGSFPQNADTDVSSGLDSANMVPRPPAGTGGVTVGFSLAGSSSSSVHLDSSLLYGGKLGYFFEPEILGGNIGVEAEGYFFQTDMETFDTDVEGVASAAGFGSIPVRASAMIVDSELEVTGLGINGLYRRGFHKNKEYPKGRFQIYAGPGLGIFIANFRSTTVFLNVNKRSDDMDTVLGFQGIGGLKVFVTPHIAIFGEYKFIQTGEFDFHIEDEGTTLATPSIETLDVKFDLTEHHLFGGVAFHF